MRIRIDGRPVFGRMAPGETAMAVAECGLKGCYDFPYIALQHGEPYTPPHGPIRLFQLAIQGKFMKKMMLVAAILAAVSFNGQAANRLAATGDAGESGEVLATVDDQPTGFRFVWQRNTGWQFAGQTPAAGIPQKMAAANGGLNATGEGYPAGTPLAEFVDQPTGFRFVWLQDQGWKFVGQDSAQALASRE